MKTLTFAEALAADPKTVQSIEEANHHIDGIERFTNLIELDLSANPNVKAFGFLKKLKKIEKLYIQELELAEIPSEVATLKKLNTLFIGKNDITSFSILNKLPSLVDLSVEQLGLRKIPDDILKIKNLKVLGLANNKISAITSLKVLTNLESLYVGNNPLKKIPKELAKLKMLRFLDISGNGHLKNCEVVADLVGLEVLFISSGFDIERFPAGMFKLSNLKNLWIGVHSKSAPDAIDALADHTLTNLETLSIWNSKLSALPKSISEMKKLTSLSLTNNTVLTNVDAIRDLPELKILNLERNKIESIGEGFSTLKKLESVNLSFNNLSNISGLRDLPLLRDLHLFTNLKTLPETLGTLTALENLQLSANGGAKVSFLKNFKHLTELYIADCVWESLPKSAGKTVQKLTVYRNDGKDSYLQYFTALEELNVTQPAFTLPKMPSLQFLSIGRAGAGIDLNEIASAKSLHTLEIHRAKTMKTLPESLSKATQVRHLEIEFCKQLEDISALESLENIETLKVQYCEKLTTLTGLGKKPKLRELELYALPCTELDIIANFGALESLILTQIEELISLPEKLTDLPHLAKVHLKDIDKLKDISVLERCVSLVDFECKGDGPTQKWIAKVNASIASRADGGTELKTSYATFMKSMYKKMVGKEDAANTYPFPLWFDTPEILLAEITEFSWIGEYLYGDDGETKDILTKPDHGLKPLAALDWGYEGCNMDDIDSYSEEFFLVDTESPLNPVFLWGHDYGKPKEIYKSFDAFLANLRDFKLENDDDDVSDSTLTHLQYVDDKSSKFWQIKVEGNTHTVTYGKIGTSGQTKEKTFDDSEAAEKAANKLIASKRKKGYGEA